MSEPPEYDPPDERENDEEELLEEGLASVVLVEPRDDVAAICGRVDTAPTFAVVVHAPKGNRQLSTELGIRRLARHAEDSGPLDERCQCPTCASYSRAYLHHLVKSGEMLGAMLMTEHNLWFYQALMQAMRDAIGHGTFAMFAAQFRRDYLGG